MNVEVTALKFDTDGLTLGVGTSNGNCILYDIRSKNPLYTKEHQYGLPVIDVTFHNTSKNVISVDKKVVKIWERHEPAMGRVLTNIETPADINAMHCVADKRGDNVHLFLFSCLVHIFYTFYYVVYQSSLVLSVINRTLTLSFLWMMSRSIRASDAGW